MSHHALLEYVRRAKDCGADDDQIRSRLNVAGWYRVDIDDALSLYHKLTKPVELAKCDPVPAAPKPSFSERIVPNTYDTRIVPVAAISFALGFIIYILAR